VPAIQEPVSNNSQLLVTPLPAEAQVTLPQVVEAPKPNTVILDDTPDTLAELVAAQTAPVELSNEMECLAGAIYFEAKSETLAGQLAWAA